MVHQAQYFVPDCVVLKKQVLRKGIITYKQAYMILYNTAYSITGIYDKNT